MIRLSQLSEPGDRGLGRRTQREGCNSRRNAGITSNQHEALAESKALPALSFQTSAKETRLLDSKPTARWGSAMAARGEARGGPVLATASQVTSPAQCVPHEAVASSSVFTLPLSAGLRGNVPELHITTSTH